MSLQKLQKAFDGKLIGSKRMQKYVCETLLLMPQEIQDYICQKCWFVSSYEDAWAFAFAGNDLKNQYLIFISDDLLHQAASQIRYTIAHEIGHVILKHRNSVFTWQTKTEINKQEREADKFAKQYLKV
jgi:Zn-dependent peptidase ImmA (M78 family)